MVENNYTKTLLASLIFAITGGVYSANAQEADFSADAMFMAQEGFGNLNTNEADDLFSLLETAQQTKESSNPEKAPEPKSQSVNDEKVPASSNPPKETPAEKEIPPMFPAETNAMENNTAKTNPTIKENIPSNPETTSEKQPQTNSKQENLKTNNTPVAQPQNNSFADVDIFSEQLSFPEVTASTTPATTTNTQKTTPAEQLLGLVDADVFREMAAIERENALLTLRAKREKLLSEIEAAKAQQRKNQLDELERREVITRNRINWEIEQEIAALQREKEREREKLLGTTLPTGQTEDDITLIYKVEEVRGVNGDLYAVLIYDQGSKINVKEGYVLKNGYKVSKINTNLVEVKRGDETALLAFANKNDVDTGTYSSPMGIR